MTGAELKVILQSTKYSLTDIATLLGKSQQAFNNILNAADVKSGTLEALCRVMKVDMSFFYPNMNAPKHITSVSVGAGSIAQSSASGDNTVTADINTVNELLKQNKQLIDILAEQLKHTRA